MSANEQTQVIVDDVVAPDHRQPAIARKGPNAMGVSLPRFWRIMITMPNKAPTPEANRMMGSSIGQPSQAPSAANSLKSPYPMPSLPVSSLKAQYTLQRLR